MFLSNDLSRRGVPTQSDYLYMVYVLVGVSLCYIVFQPCKKRYMNVFESIVYSASALMLLSFGIGRDDPLPYQVSLNHGLGTYWLWYLSLLFIVLP